MIFAIFLGGYLYQLYVGLPVIGKGLGQLLIIGAALFMIEPTIDSENLLRKNISRELKKA